MKKILLWGCGVDFKIIMTNVDWKDDIEIIGILESIKTKDSVVFLDKTYIVYGIDDLESLEYEKIVVANGAYNEILETVKRVGIDYDKIIIPYHYKTMENVAMIEQCNTIMKNANQVIDALDKKHNWSSCILIGNGRYLEFLLSVAVWENSDSIFGILDIDKVFQDHTEIKREITTVSKSFWENIKIYSSLEEISGMSITHFIVCAEDELRIRNLINGFDSDIKYVVPYCLESNKKLKTIIDMQGVWRNSENVVDTMTVFHAGQRFIQPMSCDMGDFTLMNSKQKGIRKLGMCNSDDYVRVRTLELLIREIKEKNIQGSMAEVGVFRGDFAKIMRWYLPQKKLYLFDTFCGFDERDSKYEVEKGNFTEKWPEVFKHTSCEEVKEYIGEELNTIYRVGYFPDTLQDYDMNEKFCLVSLDADMYNPTLAGLEYFYPRLVAGGYIMIHEYNAIILDGKPVEQRLKGVREAVRDFEQKMGGGNTICTYY